MTSPLFSAPQCSTLDDQVAFIYIAVPRRLATPTVISRDGWASVTTASHASVSSLPFFNFENWIWFPKLEQRLNDSYVYGSCGTSGEFTVALLCAQDYDVTNRLFVRSHLNTVSATLPLLLVLSVCP